MVDGMHLIIRVNSHSLNLQSKLIGVIYRVIQGRSLEENKFR